MKRMKVIDFLTLHREEVLSAYDTLAANPRFDGVSKKQFGTDIMEMLFEHNSREREQAKHPVDFLENRLTLYIRLSTEKHLVATPVVETKRYGVCDICYNEIVRETETAYLVSANVYFASNQDRAKARTFWMPKNLVNIFSSSVMTVQTWFIDKLRDDNAFKGYRMTFFEI